MMQENFGQGESRLSEIAASVDRAKDGSITLESALKRFTSLEKKKAYHVHTGKQGMLYYGLVGNSILIEVPEEVYEVMGRPDLEHELSVRDILTAAGYKNL